MRTLIRFLLFCVCIQPVFSSDEACEEKSSTLGRIRILSIDGGGVRGTIPLEHLVALEEKVGKPLAQVFDLFAGTSAGGIIVLGLTHPKDEKKDKSKKEDEEISTIKEEPQYTAKQLRDLFEGTVDSVFQNSFFGNIWNLGGIRSSRYPAQPLENSLQKQFGDSLFSQCIKPTMVTSWNIKDGGSPYLFKSWRTEESSRYNFYKWQVGYATAAAPTYFPSICIKGNKELDLIDGGVFANNPTLIAMAEAKVVFPDVKDPLIVSFGTGMTPQALDEGNIQYGGALSWAPLITPLMMNASNLLTDYQMTALFPPIDGRQRYFRFQSTVSKQYSALDGTTKETKMALKSIALESIKANDRALDLIADELKQNRPENIDYKPKNILRTADKDARSPREEDKGEEEGFFLINKKNQD